LFNSDIPVFCSFLPCMPDMGQNWVRLTPNGRIWYFFLHQFQHTFWLANVKKVPDLSHLVSIWPNLQPNLAYMLFTDTIVILASSKLTPKDAFIRQFEFFTFYLAQLTYNDPSIFKKKIVLFGSNWSQSRLEQRQTFFFACFPGTAIESHKQILYHYYFYSLKLVGLSVTFLLNFFPLILKSTVI